MNTRRVQIPGVRRAFQASEGEGLSQYLSRIRPSSALWLVGSAFLLASSAPAQNTVICCGQTTNGPPTIDGYTVIVTDPGSTYALPGSALTVGLNSSFSGLAITNGGLVSSGGGTVGQYAGSQNNSVLISGAGSTWLHYNGFNYDGSLDFGVLGAGNTLTISDGGQLLSAAVTNVNVNGTVYVGVNQSSSNNVVQVTGPGSVLGTNGIILGVAGAANQLIVSNGASVIGGVTMGNQISSSNNLFILTGSNSTLTAGSLLVGNGGGWNQAFVTNGASMGGALVGNGSDHNRLWISDTGTVAGGVSVGGFGGSWNELVVSNGAQISGGGLGLGSANATNNTILITGAGTSWATTSGINILGISNQLTIADHAVLSNGLPTVTLDGTGTSALVTGGSRWTNSGAFIVGSSGSGNQVSVADGTNSIACGSLFIGYSGGSSNSVFINGSNSSWTVSGGFRIGNAGTSNQLVISNGGRMFDSNALFYGNSSLVQVTGPGSSWWHSNDLTFQYARSNRLEITGGGLVASSNAWLGQYEGGNTVLVSGTNSTWSNRSDLTIGYGFGGDANALQVQAGGQMKNANGYVGNASANFNSATITGTNSVWLNNGDLSIGYSSKSNQLTIAGGALVSNANGFIGNPSLSDGNRALVTGPGSVWTNNGDLYLGFDNAWYNQLTISNGAQVFNRNGILSQSRGSADLALVTGANSLWMNSGDLFIGRTGTVNQLIITNSGVVTNGNGYIGYASSSRGNSALVTGNGSIWANAKELYVGDLGSGNQLVVTNGGLVVSSNGYVGFDAASRTNAVTISGSASTWLNNGDLFVGYSGASNQFSLANGATNKNGSAYLGNAVSSTNNSALISGNSTLWSMRSDIYVGKAGAGNQLTITNGARAENFGNMSLGDAATSSNNQALVTGGFSVLVVNSNNLYVGNAGANNKLVISNQAQVYVGKGAASGWAQVYIGNQVSSSNNAVIVTDNNSLLATNLNVDVLQVIVGEQANNNLLLVTNYGRVISTYGFIGDQASATSNRAVVTDSGQWNVQNTGSGTGNPLFDVGAFGSGNLLLITNGGVVRQAALVGGANAIAAAIGDKPGSSNNLALVTGTNSLWDVAGYLFVGNAGTGNQLKISQGGLVNNQYGIVGAQGSASNNMVWVTDPGSVWANSNFVQTGASGSQNQLVVTNGGGVTSGSGDIGLSLLSSSNSVIVTGIGSYWTNLGELHVGKDGFGNALSITGRGIVQSSNSYVGFTTNALNNCALVSGAGSLWNLNGDLYSGNSGSGNKVAISNQGTIYNVNGTIGWDTTSTNNSVTVSGPGSLWNNTGNLIVGSSGQSNSLLVANGGLVTNVNGFIGLVNSSRSNIGIVTGVGSVWYNLGNLEVGSFGQSNSLNILNSGTVYNTNGYIGRQFLSHDNTVSVSGAGAAWNNSADLTIGDNGQRNSLVITNGGTVLAVNGNIGNGASGASNSVVVTGAGSLWQNGAALQVGVAGSQNQLTIANGAAATSSSGAIGAQAGSASNVATVTGSGSTWSITNGLIVGNAGNNNNLTIQNGGTVSATTGDIGLAASGTNNSLTIDGSSSSLIISNALIVGTAGAGNSLSMSTGAQAHSGSGQIGSVAGANNNAVTVVGAGSLWDSGASLAVGNSSTGNSLLLKNGGYVNSTVAYIGFNTGADNNSASVTGPASHWNMTDLYVGYNGNGNHLTLGNSSLATVTDTAILGFNSLNNNITLLGGSLLVNNGASNATLLVLGGGILLSSGLLAADQLIVTNGLSSTIDFRGGRIDTRHTVISNSLPLIVGNGTNAASLNLLGGSHLFADGLGVSTNAYLGGFGSIFGSVTNSGTLTPGNLNQLATHPIGSVSISGGLRLTDLARLSYDIGGTGQGNTYDYVQVGGSVQFGGSLQLSLANHYVPASSNSFTLMQFGSASGAFGNIATGARLSTSDGLGSFRVDYTNSSLVLSDYESADTDGDGIADAWALQYFGHTPLTQAEKDADADGDGASNYAEFVAGTNPLDATSVFKITSISQVSADVVVVRFTYVAGKVYHLEYASGLSQPVTWNEVLFPAFTFPTAGFCEWRDDGSQTGSPPSAGPIRVYRVRVE